MLYSKIIVCSKRFYGNKVNIDETPNSIDTFTYGLRPIF